MHGDLGHQPWRARRREGVLLTGVSDPINRFRTGAVRGSARVFAVAEPIFALVSWLDPTTATPQVVFSLLGWALHLSVALTVGKRWQVTRRTSFAYLVAMGAQITLKIATSTAVDTEGFWEYLVVAGFAGVLLSPRGVAMVVALCGTAYVVAGSVAEGITGPVTAIRLIALVAMGTALRHITRRVESAVGEAEHARGVAEWQARLLSSAYQDELETVRHLREVDEMKDDFITTVSHEMRTPLTVILGMSDTVRRGLDRLPTEAAEDMLGRIHANARALDDILESLLDVSRIQRGVLVPEARPIAFAAMAERVAGRLQPLLRDHAVRVRVAADLAVRADARLLERVIENLLSNVARHTPGGTRVTISGIEQAGAAEISVCDNGPGVDPAIVGRLGERFVRGRPTSERSRSGLGIGLALVTEVLRLHGSELEVSTTPGGGATFRFRLDLATVEGDGEGDGEGAAVMPSALEPRA